MNLQRLTELSQEINTWSKENYPIRFPAMEILEQIGKAAHCVLNQRQGMRCMDDPGLFREKFLEALCGLAIYALRGAALSGVKLHDTTTGYGSRTDELFLAHLAGVSGCILLGLPTDDFGDEPHSAILSIAEHYAEFRGFYLWVELEKAWAKVKSRDWKNNPRDADRVKPDADDLEALTLQGL